MPNSKTLNFHPGIQSFLDARGDSFYTTLSGGNNSGKSVLLKNMKTRLGRRAYMVGPQRFYHIFELATQRWNPGDYDQWENQFTTNFEREEQNSEQNQIDLGRVIGSLKDTKRQALFDLCGRLIGSSFELKRRDFENELSPRYVDMDGQNLAVGSTGTRLLMTLLGLCMDEHFSVILIDEPELGLSPRIQGELCRFFSDKDQRLEFLPHLSGVFVATHSHIFLDRNDISNNFYLTKKNKDVNIDQVTNMSQLHDIQFNMLGNSLEALFLPSAFVICEGKTDRPFIERITKLRHSDRNILVRDSQGDVKRAFRNLCNSMGDIYKSPYRNRTFVVLDSVHTPGTKEDLVKMGAMSENVVVWERNGIEYMYPPEIVARIFNGDREKIGELSIADDRCTWNGITKRKVALCDEVVAAMTSETRQSDELETKLLRPLAASLGS